MDSLHRLARHRAFGLDSEPEPGPEPEPEPGARLKSWPRLKPGSDPKPGFESG